MEHCENVMPRKSCEQSQEREQVVGKLISRGESRGNTGLGEEQA